MSPLLIICPVRVQGVDHYPRADKSMYAKYNFMKHH